MSLSNKDRKIQSTSGKDIPERLDNVANGSFAQVIAEALQRDFGGTHAAVKTVVNLTKANERAVKNWFMAKMDRPASIWSIWSAPPMKFLRRC